MAITILIVTLVGVAFFAGTVLGYRTGVSDGRSLGRYQRHEAWVDDLEHALADAAAREATPTLPERELSD